MTSKTHPTWIEDDSDIPDPFGYGQRAVDFLNKLKHPKSGSGKLDPWQERIIRRIYGPRDENGNRIVKTVMLLLPRGNRKTSLAAKIALLHSVGPERIPGGECISAASDRKQAVIAYDEAIGLVRENRAISKAVHVQDYKKKFRSKNHRSYFESISSDAGTQHGRTPALAIVDELHAWKKRDLWDVIRSGLIKVSNSLLIVATTAGRGHENIAHDIVDYARKVARGEVDDESFLPILFEADTSEDWKDESVWFRTNPGLSCDPPYPDIAGLRQLAKEALERPGDREAFRQLNLNMWLDHSSTPYVEIEIFDKGNRPYGDIEGKPAWIAVDMAVVNDLAAVVACIKTPRPDGKEDFNIIPFFFCPGDNLRQRNDKDGVPYVRWSEEGFIHPTPGNVIDHSAIEGCIRGLCERFQVQEINFDPAYAQAVLVPLTDDGYPTATMRQGWVTQSPALNTLEAIILDERLVHEGHPVLRWNFENVAIKVIDDAGNRRMSKALSSEKIDGAIATWMAVSRAAADESQSIYGSDSWKPEYAYF